MKKNIFNIILISLLLFSCSTPKYYILPKGNLDLVRKSSPSDSINTPDDEVAPYLRVLERTCQAALNKENSNLYLEPTTNRIKPSNYFFRDLLGEEFVQKNKKTIDYLTKKLENVSFITNTSGFVSLSHAPDANYARIMELPFIGYVGGTDIFSFQVENGNYTFRALPEPINSPFWDSHPWVGMDSLCNLVLIWASDRDHPYSAITTLDNQVIKRGNSDLFYAFRIGNRWTQPTKFDTESLINTNDFNEISPFVACTKISPRLFFASNRDKDYDIYEVNIEIDFANQTIRPIGKAQQLPKGSQYSFDNQFINTNADEIFPIVAFPYYNEYEKELFFASNRNIIEKNYLNSRDTFVVNKGKFDIYAFPYNVECKLPPPPPPPIAKINVKVQHSQNPNIGIINPVIKLVDLTTGETKVANSSQTTFNLTNNHKYAVYGGSNLNTIGCDDPRDTIIKYYKYQEINYTTPLIIKKERKIEYDTIINPTPKVVFDTTYITDIIPISELETITVQNDFRPNTKSDVDQNITAQKETVLEIKHLKCPPKQSKQPAFKSEVNVPVVSELAPQTITRTRTTFVEVKKQVINKRIVYEGGKIQKKSYNVVEYDTISQLDTSKTIAIGPVARSQLTMLKPLELHFDKDTVINDLVLLEPEYFVKPKCSEQFIDILDDYYKNVPYYQTAFWKVNTSAGLTQHLIDMQRGNYLENAAYIELHPRNSRYGVWMGDIRTQRLKEYREYAKAVDKNLLGMKNEITEHFLPALEELMKISPETKLLVKLEAYSDIRDASRCDYIGETVSFIQGKLDNNSEIVLEKVTIKNRDNLNSDNENLSKLRVYFGFLELMNLLQKDPRFKYYLNQGLVFYPTQKFESVEKMNEALRKAKIIIIAEGKKYDPVVKENEKEYDVVRRLNMFIQLIKFSDRRVISAECCRESK